MWNHLQKKKFAIDLCNDLCLISTAISRVHSNNFKTTDLICIFRHFFFTFLIAEARNDRFDWDCLESVGCLSESLIITQSI